MYRSPTRRSDNIVARQLHNGETLKIPSVVRRSGSKFLKLKRNDAGKLYGDRIHKAPSRWSSNKIGGPLNSGKIRTAHKQMRGKCTMLGYTKYLPIGIIAEWQSPEEVSNSSLGSKKSATITNTYGNKYGSRIPTISPRWSELYSRGKCLRTNTRKAVPVVLVGLHVQSRNSCIKAETVT